MSFPDDTWRSDREAAALEGGETCRGVGVGVEHTLRKRSRRQQQTKPNYQLLGTAGLLESVARTQSKIGSHMIPKFMTKATKSGTDQWQWKLSHERKPNLCSPEKVSFFCF